MKDQNEMRAALRALAATIIAHREVQQSTLRPTDLLADKEHPLHTHYPSANGNDDYDEDELFQCA